MDLPFFYHDSDGAVWLGILVQGNTRFALWGSQTRFDESVLLEQSNFSATDQRVKELFICSEVSEGPGCRHGSLAWGFLTR